MKKLTGAFRSLLDEPFQLGEHGVSLEQLAPYTVDEGRQLDLRPFRRMIEAATRLTSGGTDSDVWLAPRLHYALRLTRREAADKGLWAWLALVEAEPFMRQRWTSANTGKVAVDRLAGRADIHGLARLWWGAELARNGSDYRPVQLMFTMQDIPNAWSRIDAWHNRALAVGAITYMATLNNGGHLGGDDVNALQKAVNSAMTTVTLDALVPQYGSDPDVVQRWITDVDPPMEPELWDHRLPPGPPDAQVDPGDLARVTALLEHIAPTTNPPLRALRRQEAASEPAFTEILD